MKICLISPNKPYLENPMSLPPLGMLYVAKSLKDVGHDVTCLDFSKEKKFIDADIHGISVTTPDFPNVIKILKYLRKAGASHIIAGGPHANINPKECLEFGFNGVSIGDGEITIFDLINGQKISEKWAKNIDEFYPDRHALNLMNYKFYIDKVSATPMMTARGCIWGKCAFCCRIDKHIRFNSMNHVKNEIDDISNLGFSAIMIYDDEFFVCPKRDLKIIEYLHQKGFIWRAFGHSKFILQNKDLLKFASKRGLKEILLGIESGSPKILATINKGATPKMNVETIKFLHNLGISVKAAMIVGLPGENKKTLEKTENFCKIVDPYISAWDFAICTPYPGSKIYDSSGEYDIKFDPKNIYTAYKGMGMKCWNPCKIETSSLTSEEIYFAQTKLEKRFKYKGGII